MAHKIIVIGGVNVDIAGIPSSKLIMRDSNPGHIHMTPGGVGRNIAENLSKLGEEVSLVTALADDTYSSIIKASCKNNNIDLSLSLNVPNSRSSVYLYIQDEAGDMVTAVNDMDIMNEITPEYLSSILSKINSYDGCVIDTNLSKEAIDYICDNVNIPIYADPVSTTKAVKIKDKLDKLTAIKPNLDEFNFLGTGSCKTFVSMGKLGIRAIWKDQDVTVPAKDVDVISTNGAGDAAMAGVVYGDLCGYSLLETAQFAVNEGTKKTVHN